MTTRRIPSLIIACLALSAALTSHARADVIDDIIDATKHARVIFMGEPDHGDGGAMAARAELTLRLHDQNAVQWVVFESSAFDARRADQAIRAGDDPIHTVEQCVLDIWSASTELDPLFRRLAESAHTQSPLRIAGMDTTPIGPADRCLHCEDILARTDSITDATLREQTRDTIQLLDAWWRTFDRTQRTTRPEKLVNALDSTSLALKGNHHSNLAREIAGWAVWIRTITPQPPLTRHAIDERDRMMADNLLAFLDTIPEHDRVVVFLHDIHAFRTLNDITEPDGTPVTDMTTPVAQHVANELGDNAYCLGLASASGSVQAAWNTRPRVISLPPDSFEHRALSPHPHAESVFVTTGPQGNAPAGVMPSGMVSFWNVSADWSTMFDGVWVLRSTHPVVRRTREDQAPTASP